MLGGRGLWGQAEGAGDVHLSMDSAVPCSFSGEHVSVIIPQLIEMPAEESSLYGQTGCPL